jgi:hypothetical protein
LFPLSILGGTQERDPLAALDNERQADLPFRSSNSPKRKDLPSSKILKFHLFPPTAGQKIVYDRFSLVFIHDDDQGYSQSP